MHVSATLIVAAAALATCLPATPADAQVPCVRHELAFACADGTSLAIYDDPRMGGPRGRMGSRGSGDGGCSGAACQWWKDERSVQGPDGEVCLVHGNHVHCTGGITDP